VNSCSINNGGCEQDCVQLSEDHYKCQCQPGYQLKADAKSCEGNPPIPQHKHTHTHTPLNMPEKDKAKFMDLLS
ncbi:hypothetical protein EK904_014069, partial [Melospiza melodia maxima]